MRNHHGRLVAVLGLSLGLAATGGLAAADDSADVYTVGELAVRLAQDLRVDLPTESAEAATAALASAGVTISGDLTRQLREKDLTEILNQLGLHLTTSKPERPVDEVRLSRLLDLVIAAPATEGAAGESTSDRGNNPPGGGFGRSKSQASPHNR